MEHWIKQVYVLMAEKLVSFSGYIRSNYENKEDKMRLGVM